MAERELPQSVRDTQEDERMARIVYGCIEYGVIIGYVAFGAYSLFLQGDFILGTTGLAGSAGVAGGFAYGRGRYENKKLKKIRQMPEPEPTLAELLPRT